jgi:hypothetical protein
MCFLEKAGGKTAIVDPATGWLSDGDPAVIIAFSCSRTMNVDERATP